MVLRAMMLLVCGGIIAPLFGAEWFVSNRGKAAPAKGTASDPFLTLEQARDAARAFSPGTSKIINIEGDFFRTNAFELGKQDSGIEKSPVLYRARKGKKARLIGGIKISGWTRPADPGLLDRLPLAARSNIWQTDLRSLGLQQFSGLSSRGFGRATTPAHNELFFAGKPMTLARWPNAGEWEKIAGFPETAGQGDEHGGKIGDIKGGFLYSGDRPARWKDFNDVWVHGYWAWDWANSYERIEFLDQEKRFIRTAPPHGLYGFRKGQRFYFLNILEELDQPGEWFIDKAKGLLYFWPPAPLESSETFLSTLGDPLISTTDASHVQFENLDLLATRGAAIRIKGGSSNLIKQCTIDLTGDEGISFQGGTGHGVAGCSISNTGDDGVRLEGGNRQILERADHFVEDCHFQKQGRWSKCYVPAVLISGVGMRVSHNLIHDHPHCAILFTGNEHLIEFNDIHHIALETGDVGAIYTGRDWTFRGNRIRNNYIHETGGVGMGSMGVYMDDCVSGTEISGNVFYKVSRAAFLGGGRDHVVENNLFIDCNPAVQIDGRGLDKSPVWHNMVYDYMKNQLAAVPQDLYLSRYPQLKDLDKYYAGTNGIPPEGNIVRHNVSLDGKWFDAGWHATRDVQGLAENFTGTKQELTSPSFPFVLKTNSPAWKSGFKPILMDQIGPRSYK